MWIRLRLLQRIRARERGLVVLGAETSGKADRADQLAADDDRVAAGRGDDVVERQQRDADAALSDALLEARGRAAEARGHARLVDRDVDRGELRVVHLLEVDEVARWAHHRD